MHFNNITIEMIENEVRNILDLNSEMELNILKNPLFII